MIFCKQCNYVGNPKWRTVGKLNEGNKEVCPNCNTAKHLEFYVDAAAAHHAKEHHNNQKASS